MKKQTLFIVLACVLTLTLILSGTYAYYKPKITSSDLPVSIVTKSIDLDVDYTGNAASVLTNLEPLSDLVGLTKNGFEFSITNNSDTWKFYKIKIIDLGVNQNQTKINSLDLKFNLSLKGDPDNLHTYTYTELKDNPIFSDKLEPNETKEYVLRAWINEDCDNDSINAVFNFQLLIEDVATPYSYQLLEEYNISHDYNAVLGCNEDYSVCETYQSIKKALNEDDYEIANVYIYDNLSFDSEATVETNQNIMLDLNGFSLTRTQTSDAIDVLGTLVINDTLETGNIYNSYTGGGRLIFTTGLLTINGGRYITDGDAAPFRAGKSGSNTGQIVINKGSFYVTNPEEKDSVFKIYSNNSYPLVINNIFAYLQATSLFNIGSGITDLANTHIAINGGIIVGNNAPEIFINKQSTTNITVTNKPLYILGKQKTGDAVLYNDDNLGVINISSAPANACLKEPLSTTTGLCIYAEGDKDYEHTEANGAIINRKDGTINIDGGTYYGGYQGIYNYNNGTINIKNAQIISGRYGLVNGHSSGYNSTIIICSSTLNSGYRDIKQNTKTGLYYYDITFKDGSHNLDSSNIKNSAGSITKLDSCPF